MSWFLRVPGRSALALLPILYERSQSSLPVWAVDAGPSPEPDSESPDSAEPVWLDSLLKKVVQPAAKRAGITKQVGWHRLRHGYSTLLRAIGTDIKVQSELLRHSNIATTMNVYTQAVSSQKRAANAVVVGQLLAVVNENSSGYLNETGCRGLAACYGRFICCVYRLCTRLFSSIARNPMIPLVAEGGFEPPTFGL